MDALTAQQRTELERDLVLLREQLTQLLEASSQGAEPVALEQPIGRVSRIDAIQQQSMVQASRRAARLRLQRVEAAFVRLNQDEYGCCAECGSEVGFPRLKARPEAFLCIACQSLREKQR